MGGWSQTTSMGAGLPQEGMQCVSSKGRCTMAFYN